MVSKKLYKLAYWMKVHKTATFMIAVIAVLAIAAIVAWYVFYRPSSGARPAVTPSVDEQELPVPAKQYFSPLTGIQVQDEAATKQQVTAIMIENSPDARPQSGMSGAGVIYEAIAEAGITRFLCLYQENKPALIGPVRSLRPYFVDWLAPYDAAVAHVGGSKRALDEVRNGSYKDIDQFFNPDAYYRSSDRFAPHNMYTTFERLDALNKSKQYVSSTFDSWLHKTDAPKPQPDASSITVDISSAAYNSSYAYDAKANHYVRSQGGAPHIDRETNNALTPKVVIVMNVDMKLGMEDGYREQITTSGNGVAHIFQDGTVVRATWSKADTKAPLKFIADDGSEVKLNAGQVWVTAIPNGESGVAWR